MQPTENPNVGASVHVRNKMRIVVLQYALLLLHEYTCACLLVIALIVIDVHI
jgi:hypothetical protein